MFLPLSRRLDADQGVPVLRRCDQHGIDVLPCEHFAEIGVHCAGIVVVIGIDDVTAAVTCSVARVANGGHAHVRVLQKTAHMPAAHSAHPDAGHHDLLARGDSPIGSQSGGGDDRGKPDYCRGSTHHTLHKFTSLHRHVVSRLHFRVQTLPRRLIQQSPHRSAR